jgi:thioredoxin 1
VDIDELTELSLEYGIQSVPVLAVVKNGKVVKKIVGLQDTDKLRKWVTESL